jgi:hypothetical protein
VRRSRLAAAVEDSNQIEIEVIRLPKIYAV